MYEEALAQLAASRAEAARLREQNRIGTELLTALAAKHGKDMRYPGEHAILAEDALIRMSTVD